MIHSQEKWWTRALLAVLVVAKSIEIGGLVDFRFIPNIVDNLSQQTDIFSQLRTWDIIEPSANSLTDDVWIFNQDKADELIERLCKAMIA